MFRFYTLLAFMALWLGGCASLPQDYARPESHVLAGTEETLLGRELQPLVAAHPGKSGFHAMHEGLDAFGARLVLVQSAERSLDVQYYIWQDDLTGRVLFNQLLAAADRGVRVRLLLDDLDTAGEDEMLGIVDAHPNVEVRLFNPFANRDRRFVDFLTDTRRINHRMHNKSLTADNQATIFGGRNIGDEYFDAADAVAFSDMDVLAIGPVVNEVSQSFDLYWNSQWVYPLAAIVDNRATTAQQISEFRQESDAFFVEAGTSDYANALRQLRSGGTAGVSDLYFSWGGWKLVYDHPGKADPDFRNKDREPASKLLQGMDQTDSELLIISPYFVPGPDFTAYLTGIAQSGKHVRVMTNSLAANDVGLVHAGYMRYRKALVAGGVELYEFKPGPQVMRARSAAKSSLSGSSRSSLHAKVLGFDRRYIFVGSFNLDARSVDINTELGVFFESPVYAQSLSDAFAKTASLVGYRVELTSGGELQWVEVEDGRELRFDVEPETSWWRRWSTGFMSLIVPEKQL